MPVARPKTSASPNASNETVMVNNAPCNSVGRNVIMSFESER